jgi:hypothetical protein
LFTVPTGNGMASQPFPARRSKSLNALWTHFRRLVASVMLVAVASLVLHGGAMAGLHQHDPGSTECALPPLGAMCIRLRPMTTPRRTPVGSAWPPQWGGSPPCRRRPVGRGGP